MKDLHTFPRPDFLPPEPTVGERWSAEHRQYDEGVRYVYRYGAHELTLFWPAPTPAEVTGLRDADVEVGLFSHGPAAFLLYKVKNVCEWSDASFNAHLVPENERELPNEAPGDRARLKITLVDSEDGIVRARRILSLDKVMTQALKHAMREQMATPFNRLIYDAAVRDVHTKYQDSDALVAVAEVVEPALG
ncbi:MAG: hypothetical protein PHD37_03360 [Gallionellaceae bacterium]|nr:hypothetical protein [Gallionellaceae bacterium]